MEITKEMKEIIEILEIFEIIEPVSDMESLEERIFITDEIVKEVENLLRIPVNDLRGERISLRWLAEFINERANSKEPFPRRYEL